jgi:hypothetical protein
VSVSVPLFCVPPSRNLLVFCAVRVLVKESRLLVLIRTFDFGFED